MVWHPVSQEQLSTCVVRPCSRQPGSLLSEAHVLEGEAELKRKWNIGVVRVMEEHKVGLGCQASHLRDPGRPLFGGDKHHGGVWESRVLGRVPCRGSRSDVFKEQLRDQ